MRLLIILSFLFYNHVLFAQQVSIDSLRSFDAFYPSYFKNLKLAEHKNKSKKSQIFDSNHNMFVAAYDYISGQPIDGRIVIVRDDDKYGLLDLKNLQLTIPLLYETIRRSNDHHGYSQYLIAKDEELYGVIYLNGDTLLPFEYNYINKIHDKLSRVIVTLDGRDQLIDFNGEMYCEESYEQIRGFIGQYSLVFEKDLKGLIDADCNEILPPVYDEILFHINGTRIVKHNSKWGMVDERGNVVLQAVFESVLRNFDDQTPVNLIGYTLVYEGVEIRTDTNFKCLEGYELNSVLKTAGVTK